MREVLKRSASKKRASSARQALNSFERLSVKAHRRVADIGLMEYRSLTILLIIRAHLLELVTILDPRGLNRVPGLTSYVQGELALLMGCG